MSRKPEPGRLPAAGNPGPTGPGAAAPSPSDVAWARRIFRASILKQQKVEAIRGLLGSTDGLRCLDIGGDNGVVSLLLRDSGGSWTSADLTDESVASIRRLVGDPVVRFDGRWLPFPDRSFDVVVAADVLEHVSDDRTLAHEMWRVLRPRGTLIANVPHLRPRSLLRRIRPLVGLTDEKHGHVRPGYTRAGLRALLEEGFEIEREMEYCGSFSESLDIALNAVLERRTGGEKRSAKGPLVTGSDLERHGPGFGLLSAAVPLLRAWAALDALLPLQARYRLILKCRRPADDLREAPPASRTGP